MLQKVAVGRWSLDAYDGIAPAAILEELREHALIIGTVIYCVTAVVLGWHAAGGTTDPSVAANATLPHLAGSNLRINAGFLVALLLAVRALMTG